MQFFFFKIQLTDRRLLLVYLNFKIEFFFSTGQKKQNGWKLDRKNGCRMEKQ